MESCCAVGSETCHFASQLPRGVSGSHPTRLNGLRDCGPPSAGFRHRVGTGVSKDAISWLRSRGRRFVLGPIPRLVLLRKCGEKARNQACQAPRPLRAVPPPPSSTAGSGLAGTPCRVGGWERPRARRPRRLPRPAAARRCHCGKRAALPPPPAGAPGAVCPLAMHGGAAARPWAAGAERPGPTGAVARRHGAHAAGAGLGRETCPTLSFGR